MPPPSRPELNDRQREILQAIVQDYIATAEPVGSRTLIKRNKAINVSAATVRNAMADLEDLGYLSATHASAGRIPTPAAIRVYVENLVSRGKISQRDREVIHAVAFPGDGANLDVKRILTETGRALSTLARHATLVLMPSIDDVVFADIEFMPVRHDSVLMMFVARSGIVQHRVIPVDFPIHRDELRRMSSYLKGLLDGKTLSAVRHAIIGEMRKERAQADDMMRRALMLGEAMLDVTQAPEANVVVDGERKLLDQPEFSDIEKMRKLLRAFEEKTLLLRLLGSALANPVEASLAEREDTQVVFGAEAQVRDAQDLAMVVSGYDSAGASGRVGVVGPMRMDYARVIPLVEFAAESLSAALSDPSDDPERND